MLTELQKQTRLKGIGASESAILFDLSEYSTPYQLWLEKTGQPQAEVDNDNFWWGTELEPVIRKRYEHETKKSVVYDPETKFTDLSPYMMAHLDGILPEEKKLLEIKTARYNPSHWGQAGTSEVPPQYTIQCQHQLACMPGYESVDLCVFFWQTKSIVIYNIKRNEVIIDKIVNAVHRFWNDHVIPKIAPDLYTIEDVKIVYPTDNQTWIEASPIEIDAHRSLVDVRSRKKEIEAEELKYKTDLIILTGGASGIKRDGELLCTYKANVKGNRTFLMYGES